jgi:hypothetical protein
MVQDYDRGWMLRRPSEARTHTGALFGRTMGLVAVTVGLFVLGAYLARNLSGGGPWRSGSHRSCACSP